MKHLIILIFMFCSIIMCAIPESFSVPIERVPITSFGVYSLDGRQIDKVMVGEKVTLKAKVENLQNIQQSFVYAIWITDEKGNRVHENWIDATLEPNSSSSSSISWIPMITGNYHHRIKHMGINRSSNCIFSSMECCTGGDSNPFKQGVRFCCC